VTGCNELREAWEEEVAVAQLIKLCPGVCLQGHGNGRKWERICVWADILDVWREECAAEGWPIERNFLYVFRVTVCWRYLQNVGTTDLYTWSLEFWTRFREQKFCPEDIMVYGESLQSNTVILCQKRLHMSSCALFTVNYFLISLPSILIKSKCIKLWS
jgi:hypothetical protein